MLCTITVLTVLHEEFDVVISFGTGKMDQPISAFLGTLDREQVLRVIIYCHGQDISKKYGAVERLNEPTPTQRRFDRDLED